MRAVVLTSVVTLASACSYDWSPLEAAATDAASVDASSADAPSCARGSAYRSAILCAGPAHYWRLGESAGATMALDEIAGAADASYVGSFELGKPGALAGDPNTAASFDGVSGCLEAGPAVDLSGNRAFSIEAWVNPSVDANYRRVYNELTPDAMQGLSLAVTTGGFTLERYVNGVVRATGTGSAPPVGVYTYVVASYDGATLRIYTNGTLAASNGDARAMPVASAPPQIGCRNGAPSAFFAGTLDEVALYTRAIGAPEVKAHYTAGLDRASDGG